MNERNDPEPLRDVLRDCTPYVRGLCAELREQLAQEIRETLARNRRAGF